MGSKKLKDKAINTLRALEDNGGPEVGKVIKGAIPTYSNTWPFDNDSSLKNIFIELCFFFQFILMEIGPHILEYPSKNFNNY